MHLAAELDFPRLAPRNQVFGVDYGQPYFGFCICWLFLLRFDPGFDHDLQAHFAWVGAGHFKAELTLR